MVYGKRFSLEDHQLINNPFLLFAKHDENEHGRAMNISGAWRLGFTGKNVVVTILDDGIEKDHPDLKQNYVSI